MTEQVVIQVRDKIHEGKLKAGDCVRRCANGKTPGNRITQNHRLKPRHKRQFALPAQQLEWR